MPKLVILQGPHNVEKLAELCRMYDACAGDVHDMISKYKAYSPKRCRDFGIGVAFVYMDANFNIVYHDTFETNKEASKLVKAADVRGYEIMFVRLPDATGEELTWQDCFCY